MSRFLPMRLRVGLISADKNDVARIRESLPDLFVVHAKSIIDFYQINGSQKIDAVIFLYPQGQPTKDFFSSCSFIRTKKAYEKVPVAGISGGEELVAKSVITDPLIRAYTSKEGVFLPLLHFMKLMQNPALIEHPIPADFVETEFEKALSAKVGQGNEFLCRPATDDEAHEGFFAQELCEIASNLSWVKFSARILNEGSKGLKDLFKGLTEEEIEETSSQILRSVLDEYRNEMRRRLLDVGAVFGPLSDSITPQERIQIVKHSKSTFLIFESGVCSVVMEKIQYI